MLSASRAIDVSKLVELLRVPAVYNPFTSYEAGTVRGTYGIQDELRIMIDPRSPTEEVFIVGDVNHIRAEAEGHTLQRYAVANFTHPRKGGIPMREHYTGTYFILSDPLHQHVSGDTGQWRSGGYFPNDAITYQAGWYVSEYTLHYIAWSFYSVRGKRGQGESVSFPVTVRIGGRENSHSFYDSPEVAQVSFARVKADGTVLLNVAGFRTKCEVPLSDFLEARRETPARREQMHQEWVKADGREAAEHWWGVTWGRFPIGALPTLRRCNTDWNTYFDPNGVSTVLVAWERFVETGLLSSKARYLSKHRG